MFKNSVLAAFPDKGLDDASPISLCRKYRYVIQVFHTPPYCIAQPALTAHVQIRYLQWGYIWKEVLKLPAHQWKVPQEVVLGKWDTLVDTCKEAVEQFENQ